MELLNNKRDGMALLALTSKPSRDVFSRFVASVSVFEGSCTRLVNPSDQQGLFNCGSVTSVQPRDAVDVSDNEH